jgi:6-pyruvoyltetrahydropterin/6-carboxytetrahydropterin synthase
MYRIVKEFHFCASHELHGLSDSHPCSRVHGHNYRVKLELSSDMLDERGFVRDFGELAPFREMIDETLDHRHLNDVLLTDDGSVLQPSAENIARWLHDWAKERWPEVSAVRVWETDKCFVEYRPLTT